MIDGYEKSSFETDAVDGDPLAHDVYTRGEGPPVILIQELPGIGQEMLRLADRMVAAGFTVVMPHLFGPIGRLSFVGNIARLFCMRREFALFAADRASPVTRWLAALAADVKARTGAPGVGVIGMCLTGNFAITLMAEPAVLAAVASQPSLPVAKPRALHMSADEIAAARAGLDEKGPMLAYRFKGDKLCTAAKFDALDAAFNDDRERIRLKQLPGAKHALLTVHFIDEDGSPTWEALNEITEYMHERLDGAGAG